jgi:hypothetical protein
MADKHITSDPDFLALPPEEKRKVLIQTDSDFAGLPSDQQDLVLQHFSSTPPIAGLAPGSPDPTLPPQPSGRNPIQENIHQQEVLTRAFNDTPEGDLYYGTSKAVHAIPGAAKGIASIPSLLGIGDPEVTAKTQREFVNGIEAPAIDAYKRYPSPAARVGLPLLAGADAFAGGDPTSAMNHANAGEFGKAIADLLAAPLAMHGVSKGTSAGLSKLPGMVRELPTLADKDSQYATEGMASKVASQPNFNQPGIWPTLAERLRQAARDSGVTAANLKEMFPTGNREVMRPSTWFRGTGNDIMGTPVQKGFQKRLEVLNNLADSYNNQYESILNPYRGQSTMAGGRAAAALRSSITPAEATASPSLKFAIDAIADNIEQASKSDNSLGALNDLRKEFNKAADRVYSQSGAAGISDNDLQVADAQRRAADAIRNSTYDDLSKISTIPEDQIRALQREHGAARAYVDEAMKQGQAVQPAESEARRLGRLNLLGGSAKDSQVSSEASLSRGKVIKRALTRTPQAAQNNMMRQALSGLGEGGAAPSVTAAARPEAQLPYPSVAVPTELLQTIPTESPISQEAGVQSFTSTPVKQLPPISSAEVQGAGAPTVEGGVFPNRPAVSTPSRIANLDPRLPSAYAYERKPFFVTDYIGSGRAGEPAAMPGTSRALTYVSTPDQATEALSGYKKYMASDEFKKLDPTEQSRITEQAAHLDAFSKQGKAGPVSRISVNQFAEPSPAPSSTTKGANAGTIQIRTPKDAQTMLDDLGKVDTTHMDSTTRAKLSQTIDELKKLAAIGPSGKGLPKLTMNPGKPATITKPRMGVKTLPKLLIHSGNVVNQAEQRGRQEP